MNTQGFDYTEAGKNYIREGDAAEKTAKKIRARFKPTAVKTGKTTPDGKAVRFSPKPLEVVKSPDTPIQTPQTITRGYKEIGSGDLLLNEKGIDAKISKMSKEEIKAHVAVLIDLVATDQERQAAVNRTVRMKTEQAKTLGS